MKALQIPDGWKLETIVRSDDYLLLSSPPSPIYYVTIDLRARGFRNGYTTTGRFVGEEWNKKRKKYGGRGWRQALVDDAVASLKEDVRIHKEHLQT